MRELVGEGWEPEFHDTVSGNRSPLETPLMDSIRGFVQREDPDSDSRPDRARRLLGLALVAGGVPRVRRLGFFPQRAMDDLRGLRVDARRGRARALSDVGWAAAFYAELMETTLR